MHKSNFRGNRLIVEESKPRNDGKPRGAPPSRGGRDSGRGRESGGGGNSKSSEYGKVRGLPFN